MRKRINIIKMRSEWERPGTEANYIQHCYYIAVHPTTCMYQYIDYVVSNIYDATMYHYMTTTFYYVYTYMYVTTDYILPATCTCTCRYTCMYMYMFLPQPTPVTLHSQCPGCWGQLHWTVADEPPHLCHSQQHTSDLCWTDSVAVCVRETQY